MKTDIKKPIEILSRYIITTFKNIPKEKLLLTFVYPLKRKMLNRDIAKNRKIFMI